MSLETMDTLQTFVSRLADHGEKTAVVAVHKSDIEAWSFAQLVNAAQRLAAGLRKAGLPPGAPVLLCAPNSPEWLVACFALLAISAVPVVVDTQLSDEDLRHVLDDSEVRWATTTLHLTRRLSQYRNSQHLTCILLDPEKDDRRSWRNYEVDPKDPFPLANPADPAVLFYTSGTTGAPKGVPLTHRNLTANLQAFLSLQLIKDTDRFLLPLPLHHVYPFTVGMLAPLAAGVTLVFPRSLTGPQIVRALQTAHVTVIIGVPRFYTALYAAIEARVRQRGRLATTFFQRALACSIGLRRRFGLYVGKWLFASFHKQFAPHLRAVCSAGAAIEPDLAWKLEGLGWQTAG
ncbi:MAG: AMP-binding protein, partial [Candidatus Binatia bacterium]